MIPIVLPRVVGFSCHEASLRGLSKGEGPEGPRPRIGCGLLPPSFGPGKVIAASQRFACCQVSIPPVASFRERRHRALASACNDGSTCPLWGGGRRLRL